MTIPFSKKINNKGVALVAVILLVLMVLPAAIFLATYLQQQIMLVNKEKQLKSASVIANNVLIDFMRQFSQNYYDGHYDESTLARNETFYGVGFSTVTVEASPYNHSLFLTAIGRYGANKANPLASKKLYANIQFISDLTDFGTLINGSFIISASNVTYSGKWWITGDLGITGSNVKFVGGPLIVGGNVTGGTGCTVEGDLYYGGTSAGSVNVIGTKYNFYPSDMSYPNINESYYKQNYNYKLSGTDKTLIFNASPTQASFTIVGSSTVVYPTSGFIILCEGISVTVYGTVKGRVTVVTTNPGGITIGLSNTATNLLYYNPLTNGTTNTSYYGNSFSAISANGITFQGKTTSPTLDLTVCGVFFNRSAANMQANGGSTNKLSIYGTRNKPITTTFGSTYMVYDIWLNKNPSPGLPERPILVNWHIK